MDLNDVKMISIFQVRVDFVDTEFLTPKDGNCNEQYFIVSGTIWPIGVNQICGINPGYWKSKFVKK